MHRLWIWGRGGVAVTTRPSRVRHAPFKKAGTSSSWNHHPSEERRSSAAAAAVATAGATAAVTSLNRRHGGRISGEWRSLRCVVSTSRPVHGRGTRNKLVSWTSSDPRPTRAWMPHCESPFADSDGVVQVEEGEHVKVAVLNRPKKLNALSREMIDRLLPLIHRWINNETLRAVFVRSATPKVFCAGGDVTALVAAAKLAPPGQNNAAMDFFRREYMLNHLLAGSNTVPIVAVMDGVTMGGGVGLSVHCDFRIATENTVFAMPETAIGLFPDVGAAWFLKQTVGRPGMVKWLCLTGARLTGKDCFALGIATHYMPSHRVSLVIDDIGSSMWPDEERMTPWEREYRDTIKHDSGFYPTCTDHEYTAIEDENMDSSDEEDSAVGLDSNDGEIDSTNHYVSEDEKQFAYLKEELLKVSKKVLSLGEGGAVGNVDTVQLQRLDEAIRTSDDVDSADDEENSDFDAEESDEEHGQELSISSCVDARNELAGTILKDADYQQIAHDIYENDDKNHDDDKAWAEALEMARELQSDAVGEQKALTAPIGGDTGSNLSSAQAYGVLDEDVATQIKDYVDASRALSEDGNNVDNVNDDEEQSLEEIAAVFRDYRSSVVDNNGSGGVDESDQDSSETDGHALSDESDDEIAELLVMSESIDDQIDEDLKSVEDLVSRLDDDFVKQDSAAGPLGEELEEIPPPDNVPWAEPFDRSAMIENSTDDVDDPDYAADFDAIGYGVGPNAIVPIDGEQANEFEDRLDDLLEIDELAVDEDEDRIEIASGHVADLELDEELSAKGFMSDDEPGDLNEEEADDWFEEQVANDPASYSLGAQKVLEQLEDRYTGASFDVSQADLDSVSYPEAIEHNELLNEDADADALEMFGVDEEAELHEMTDDEGQDDQPAMLLAACREDYLAEEIVRNEDHIPDDWIIRGADHKLFSSTSDAGKEFEERRIGRHANPNSPLGLEAPDANAIAAERDAVVDETADLVQTLLEEDESGSAVSARIAGEVGYVSVSDVGQPLDTDFAAAAAAEDESAIDAEARDVANRLGLKIMADTDDVSNGSMITKDSMYAAHRAGEAAAQEALATGLSWPMDVQRRPTKLSDQHRRVGRMLADSSVYGIHPSLRVAVDDDAEAHQELDVRWALIRAREEEDYQSSVEQVFNALAGGTHDVMDLDSFDTQTIERIAQTFVRASRARHTGVSFRDAWAAVQPSLKTWVAANGDPFGKSSFEAWSELPVVAEARAAAVAHVAADAETGILGGSSSARSGHEGSDVAQDNGPSDYSTATPVSHEALLKQLNKLHSGGGEKSVEARRALEFYRKWMAKSPHERVADDLGRKLKLREALVRDLPVVEPYIELFESIIGPHGARLAMAGGGDVDETITAIEMGDPEFNKAVEVVVRIEELMAGAGPPPGQETGTVLDNSEEIEELFKGETVEEIMSTLRDAAPRSKVAAKALKAMEKASPTSLKITLEQLHNMAGPTDSSGGIDDELRLVNDLESALIQDYALATRLATGGDTDFFEGVRAMLVDKDKKPRWNPPTVEEVSRERIAEFFNFNPPKELEFLQRRLPTSVYDVAEKAKAWGEPRFDAGYTQAKAAGASKAQLRRMFGKRPSPPRARVNMQEVALDPPVDHKNVVDEIKVLESVADDHTVERVRRENVALEAFICGAEAANARRGLAGAANEQVHEHELMAGAQGLDEQLERTLRNVEETPLSPGSKMKNMLLSNKPLTEDDEEYIRQNPLEAGRTVFEVHDEALGLAKNEDSSLKQQVDTLDGYPRWDAVIARAQYKATELEYERDEEGDANAYDFVDDLVNEDPEDSGIDHVTHENTAIALELLTGAQDVDIDLLAIDNKVGAADLIDVASTRQKLAVQHKKVETEVRKLM